MKSQSLGLNVQQVTYIVLIVASIMTAVVVAYVGVIGFIGMIIPQLIRKFYWRYQIGLQMLLNIIIGAVVMITINLIYIRKSLNNFISINLIYIRKSLNNSYRPS